MKYHDPGTITKQSHPNLVALAMKIFPDYRGRKFGARVQERYRVWDFWDGGSRTYTQFVDLRTGKTVPSGAIPETLRQKAGNPFGLAITDEFPLPEYLAVVEHRISCGKDVGLRVILPPTHQGMLTGDRPSLVSQTEEG